jgi:UDP-N-acetylglucosamine pyrophosphorylase
LLLEGSSFNLNCYSKEANILGLNQLKNLELLWTILKPLSQIEERLILLRSVFGQDPLPFKIHVYLRDSRDEYLLLLFVFVGQGALLEKLSGNEKKIISLLDQLQEIDDFYVETGGIIGYQILVLQLLSKEKITFDPLVPLSNALFSKDEPVNMAVSSGISALVKTCEIYVIGGAAERLNYTHPETGLPVPAAAFEFLGDSLLKHLIDDLFAREYLYFRVFKKQLNSTIALMTSDEKDNHYQIQKMIEKDHYFFRSKEDFILFKQPSVPVVDHLGFWQLSGKGELILKPAGHGAIWKVCATQGIFDLLIQKGFEKAVVRQINNPLTSTDQNILGLIGYGCEMQKSFGFFATRRKSGATEGAIVTKILEEGGGGGKVITNVEYCEVENNALTTSYPANTNLLFVDLNKIKEAVKKMPYPGALLNFKSSSHARVELTMQNIAEAFIDPNKDPMLAHQETFVVMQEREKAISVIKRLPKDGTDLSETPQRAFYDLWKVKYDLLIVCGFQLPECVEFSKEFLKNPPFLFSYSKALGPLHEVIAQKLKRGNIHPHSHINLEVVECYVEDLTVDGSFEVKTRYPCGYLVDNKLKFSGDVAKCVISGLTVKNQGINWENFDPLSPDKIVSTQSCKIIIERNALLFIKDCELIGNVFIHVKENTALLIEGNKRTEIPISNIPPLFEFDLQEDGKIALQLTLLESLTAQSI